MLEIYLKAHVDHPYVVLFGLYMAQLLSLMLLMMNGEFSNGDDGLTDEVKIDWILLSRPKYCDVTMSMSQLPVSITDYHFVFHHNPEQSRYDVYVQCVLYVYRRRIKQMSRQGKSSECRPNCHFFLHGTLAFSS